MKKQSFVIILLALFLVGCITTTFAEQGHQVRISSNVKGASIFVDGKYIGNAPLMYVVTRGTHTFRAESPGYKTVEKQITITRNLTFSLDLQAGHIPDPRPRFFDLRVSANVPHAEVYIDGDYKGKAPVSVKVKEGSVDIKVTARGYDDYTETVRVSRDLNINATLEREQRSYTLSISANVRNAKVYINSRELHGFAPMTERLREGKYNIRVESRGLKDYETEIYLNRDMKIYAELRSSDPTVKIIIPPNILNNKIHNFESRIDIYVDGRKQRDFEFTVNAGSHTIRIESGAFALEDKIYFRDGKSYTIKLGFGMDVSD